MRRGRRAPRQERSRPFGAGRAPSQPVGGFAGLRGPPGEGGGHPAGCRPGWRRERGAGGRTDPPAGSGAQNSGRLFGGDPGRTRRTGEGARGTLASLTRLGSRGGEWAAVPPPLGGGGGAQTKGACAFKAGSPGAGGEGTSGSGVEGGCAGQQGRGRGPEALPRGGRDSRDARARSSTAGRPAGRPEPAGGRGGAASRARRRPPAGERGGAGSGEALEAITGESRQFAGCLRSAGGDGNPGAPRAGLEAPTLAPRH